MGRVARMERFGYTHRVERMTRVSQAYLGELSERARESRAFRKHQAIGIELAEILNDPTHTALYIKLAKERDPAALLELARSVASRPRVVKRGAYFMRLVTQSKAR